MNYSQVVFTRGLRNRHAIFIIKETVAMRKIHKPLLILAIISIASMYFLYWDLPGLSINSSRIFSFEQVYCEQAPESQSRNTTLTEEKRINVVLLGIEGKARADTIMFFSYDKAESNLHIISVPRDTYFYEKGYSQGDQRKINAAYGRGKEEGCVSAVRKVLCDAPADYYLSIDYEGVEGIVDAIGGVELEVPFDMEAGGIEIPKGKQVLYGKEALQYLRYRKSYPDGDIGRIRAQQKLIKAVLSKTGKLELTKIISKVFGSIETNMPIGYMAECAEQFRKNGVEDITMHILPGTAMYKYIDGFNWSYYFHSPQKVKELVDKVYGIESMEEKKRKRCEPY